MADHFDFDLEEMEWGEAPSCPQCGGELYPQSKLESPATHQSPPEYLEYWVCPACMWDSVNEVVMRDERIPF